MDNQVLLITGMRQAPRLSLAGMAEMQDMAAHGMTPPENTLPMMAGEGPFGPIEMGGMFTVVKVREDIAPGDYSDPGWFEHPEGTVAYKVDENGRRLA